MFNEVDLNSEAATDLTKVEEVLPLDRLLKREIIKEIERFKSGEIDNLIIHGFPIPSDLPDTPSEIREIHDDIYPAYILKSIGNFLGAISQKGVENTIRFRTGNMGIVNEETWHGHYQYQYTCFYCLKGDDQAKTYLLSVNNLIKNASEDIAQLLLTSFSYSPERPAFSLVSKGDHGYSLSHNIYDRSDFEKYVKDLDLPDVIKALEKIHNQSNPEAERSLRYLLTVLKNPESYISYKAGDVALYDERNTIRFSPSFNPSAPKGQDRWLLALTVEV